MGTPKYEIGQEVKAKVNDNEWTGVVLSIGCVDENVYEYSVSNAPKAYEGSLWPLLAWEDELSPIETAPLVLEEPEATT